MYRHQIGKRVRSRRHVTLLSSRRRSLRWLASFCCILAVSQWTAVLNESCGKHTNNQQCTRGWILFADAQQHPLLDEDKGSNSGPRIRAQRLPRASHNIRGGALTAQYEDPSPTEDISPTPPQSSNTMKLFLTSLYQGLGGGVSGALAGAVQVVTLMWLRTIMTYQLRYGTTFTQALHTLLREGGIARLYRGLAFALVQAPLSRFVSTAANDGVNALLGRLEATKHWGPGRKVAIASLVVGFWRMVLMPIDTMKTVLQVDSVDGFRNLIRRVKAGRIGLLYQGTIATYLSSVMGHYPWYWTYNMLETSPWLKGILRWNLLRSAGIGFVASLMSDTVINSIRVVKTTKQSLGAKHAVTYGEAIRMVVAADGWKGLFGRGLGTRIMGNAIQSVVFTVIWRSLADATKGKSEEAQLH